MITKLNTKTTLKLRILDWLMKPIMNRISEAEYYSCHTHWELFTALLYYRASQNRRAELHRINHAFANMDC